ncbi:hypothetical protein DHEL01_v212474 [Diaporthe helianthi]|uniref:Peptidase A2 domain-containing protein n=1 Tax=Diaporthe helianthi TaxID=158607 RepID=A0A2P5HFV4_DIAHE|nr:hypothetical protein DHEL01_v212474 [Diaporthe helianthi]
MHYGAIMRGGFTTVELEKAAEFLEKQEEARRAKFDEMRDSARWMWLFNPGSGEAEPVEILMDTGADANIMTEGMAKDYNLKMIRLGTPETFEMTVGEFTCLYQVEVSWRGARDKYDKMEFYIVSSQDARIQTPLLGRVSIQETKDSLLMECPRKTIAYTAMKKKTPEDEMRTRQAREQALADRTKLAQDKTTYQEARSEQRRAKGSSSKVKKS